MNQKHFTRLFGIDIPIGPSIPDSRPEAASTPVNPDPETGVYNYIQYLICTVEKYSDKFSFCCVKEQEKQPKSKPKPKPRPAPPEPDELISSSEFSDDSDDDYVGEEGNTGGGVSVPPLRAVKPREKDKEETKKVGEPAPNRPNLRRRKAEVSSDSTPEVKQEVKVFVLPKALPSDVSLRKRASDTVVTHSNSSAAESITNTITADDKPSSTIETPKMASVHLTPSIASRDVMPDSVQTKGSSHNASGILRRSTEEPTRLRTALRSNSPPPEASYGLSTSMSSGRGLVSAYTSVFASDMSVHTPSLSALRTTDQTTKKLYFAPERPEIQPQSTQYQFLQTTRLLPDYSNASDELRAKQKKLTDEVRICKAQIVSQNTQIQLLNENNHTLKQERDRLNEQLVFERGKRDRIRIEREKMKELAQVEKERIEERLKAMTTKLNATEKARADERKRSRTKTIRIAHMGNICRRLHKYLASKEATCASADELLQTEISRLNPPFGSLDSTEEEIPSANPQENLPTRKPLSEAPCTSSHEYIQQQESNDEFEKLKALTALTSDEQLKLLQSTHITMDFAEENQNPYYQPAPHSWSNPSPFWYYGNDQVDLPRPSEESSIAITGNMPSTPPISAIRTEPEHAPKWNMTSTVPSNPNDPFSWGNITRPMKLRDSVDATETPIANSSQLFSSQMVHAPLSSPTYTNTTTMPNIAPTIIPTITPTSPLTDKPLTKTGKAQEAPSTPITIPSSESSPSLSSFSPPHEILVGSEEKKKGNDNQYGAKIPLPYTLDRGLERALSSNWGRAVDRDRSPHGEYYWRNDPGWGDNRHRRSRSPLRGWHPMGEELRRRRDDKKRRRSESPPAGRAGKKSKTSCRYYLQGNCRRGGACNFSHDS